MLASAGGLSLVSSCDRPAGDIAPAPLPPETRRMLTGVPHVRVRLLGKSVSDVQIEPTGSYLLSGAIGSGDRRGGTVRVTRTGGAFDLAGRSGPPGAGEVTLTPLGETVWKIGGRIYRGSIRLSPAAADRFHVINDIDLESYLAGVLAKEILPNWHEQTYRAQCVAARSFALYQMRTFGLSHPYDVHDNQSSQVYGGLSAETQRAWRAVLSTRGMVLTCQGRLFLTMYSSTCGGRVNDAEVIGPFPDIPPHRGGQVCQDCRASSRYAWPAVRVPKSQILAALRGRYGAARDLRRVATIEVTRRTSYGRAVWIEVRDGQGGKLRIRAEDLRMALLLTGQPAGRGLHSMNCRMVDAGDAIVFTDGHGWGHGVGLCQWGAEGKSRQGWSAERILAFYYPGSELTRAY